MFEELPSSVGELIVTYRFHSFDVKQIFSDLGSFALESH